ncbi:O-phosphoserine phosphohydrolase [Aphelenchoides fujianensis]|nr:O-phosphoserine phosphohydrolase [Aphelenchoides fujianensis]
MGFEVRCPRLIATEKPASVDEAAQRRRAAEQHARRVWRSADAVCFDVDSTVCQDEAIDELAKFLGKGEEVARCTQKAMSGGMSFRQALEARLEVMRPTRAQVIEYATTHPVLLTPGIVELVRILQEERKADVFLVSGGFRDLIVPVARHLGIPESHIFANRILFHPATGEYVDFDRTEPTSDSGNKTVGKARVCGLLKENRGYQNLVMVGDGATDAEARPPADVFVGFGGNQVREVVKQRADWFVHSFQELVSELTNLTTV